MNPPSIHRRGLLVSALSAAIIAPSVQWSAAAEATPTGSAPDAGAGGGVLLELLAQAAPSPRSTDGPATQIFTFADIARQLEVRGLRGLEWPIADGARVAEWGFDGLWLDDIVVRFPLEDDLWSGVGLDPSQVTQTLSLGDPPQIVRMLRGAFDGRAIGRALTASGYELRATDSGDVWSIGAEGEIDPDHPIQRMVPRAYNNFAVIDDSLVVASPSLALVEATLAVRTGAGPSFATAETASLGLIQAAGEELVSAALIDGRYLSRASLLESIPDSVPSELFPTPSPDETIAEVALALFGITPGTVASRFGERDDPPPGNGSAPPSDLLIVLQLNSVEEAKRAAPIIERRLASGLSAATRRPYADYFEHWTATVFEGGPFVRIRLSGERVGLVWIDFLLRQDLGFLATG